MKKYNVTVRIECSEEIPGLPVEVQRYEKLIEADDVFVAHKKVFWEIPKNHIIERIVNFKGKSEFEEKSGFRV